MKGGIGSLMKQAQKMQEDMRKAQEEIASMRVDGVAGGGLVKVVMNGAHELSGVTIDASLFAEGDREMVEDLVAAAVNDASQKLAAASRDKLSGLAGGLDLPPGMKLPF